MAFLDESGLQRFWENIVSKFVRKVDGKDLSSNDFTDEEKEKLAGLENYTLPVATTESLGGIKSGGDITVAENGDITVNKAATVTLTNELEGYMNLIAYSDSENEGAKLIDLGEASIQACQVRMTDALGTRTVTTLEAPYFVGDGSRLTNLNASKITSGTIPAERLPNATTSKSGAMSSEDKTYIESLKAELLDTFTNKTIADLQAALNTWLESNLVVNATTYISVTEDSLVNGWNSGDTTSALQDGPRWFFTVTAVYSNANYVALRLSSYHNQNVYSIIRSNGQWRNIKKFAIADLATTSASGLMSSDDKNYIEKLKENNLGSFTNKTIADLQSSLTTWLSSNVDVIGASAYFTANGTSLIDGWNSGDTSSVLTGGNRWSVTVIGSYSAANYVALRLSSYNSNGATYIVTKYDGTWGKIKELAFTDSIDNIKIKDTDVIWGGDALSNNVSPIGASLSSEHSANRLAYLNPNALAFEYSDDGGSTWTDMSVTDVTKTGLVTTSANIYIGNSSTVTTNHRTRLTLTAQDGTNSYIYTRVRKLLFNVNTSGHGISVTIEIKTGKSDAAWVTVGTYPLSGWPGWNEIPSSFASLGGSSSQTSNYWYMRLTFATTSVDSSYTTTRSRIVGIRLFGENVYTATSNMGRTGHLYSYDTNQNAIFPANITATRFIGDGYGLTNLPVSFTQNLTSGEKIGTININGTNTDIFAPEGSDGGNIYGVHDGKGNVTLMIGDAETEATTITPEIIGAADRNHTHNNMTGATTSNAGTSGFVPAPAAGVANRFLRADGTWQEVTISGGGTVSGDYLPLSGGTVTGDVAITATTASTSTTTGALKVSGGVGVAGDVYANAVVGAVWNDYAETRKAYSEDFKYMKPGCVVTECAIENDTVRLTDKRLEKIPMVITDTYGFLIGEKEGDVVPVAVAGRVLVNTYEDRSKFELGDAVCSGPNGTVSIMTYEELLTFPDRVLGYVSCIPDYDTWGEVKVNNRIWIKLK